MQSFIEAMVPYINPNGNVVLQPGSLVDEDNNHLFRVTYLTLQVLLFGNELNTISEYINYYDFIDCCKIQAGLYRRSPSNFQRLISHDEMIAISTIRPAKALDIVEYGKNNLWCYDNRVPGECTVRSWQGRFLAAIPYYHARAGIPLTLWQKTRWALNTVITAFSPKGDTSGKCLTYMMTHAMSKQDSWLIRLSIKVFRYKCTKLYGNLSGLYSIYFGPNHPFSLYSNNIDFYKTL